MKILPIAIAGSRLDKIDTIKINTRNQLQIFTKGQSIREGLHKMRINLKIYDLSYVLYKASWDRWRLTSQKSNNKTIKCISTSKQSLKIRRVIVTLMNNLIQHLDHLNELLSLILSIKVNLGLPKTIPYQDMNSLFMIRAKIYQEFLNSI